jgi:amidophosphoribosyltransferase
MVASTGQPADRYCMACFTGEYPIEIPEEVRRGKMALEKPVC